MKKNGYWKGFVSGLLMTVLLLSMCLTVSAAANRSIQVEDGIKITLNGSAMTPRDATGKEVPVFLYNGTTYVPARAISEALGLNVSFNSATRTVVLTSKSAGTGTTGGTSTSTGTSTSGYITADRAKEIALADAGLSASNVVFIRAQQDWDDGRAVYEVEFYSGSVEYDYEIDATTGAIRSADRDVEGFTVPSTTPSTSSGATITADRAKEIALAEVPGGTVFKCQLDRDDGRLVYEVEVYTSTAEYDFEIDAQTGSILSRDMDYRGW